MIPITRTQFPEDGRLARVPVLGGTHSGKQSHSASPETAGGRWGDLREKERSQCDCAHHFYVSHVIDDEPMPFEKRRALEDFGQTADRPYADRQFIPGDYDAQAGQGRINDHGAETPSGAAHMTTATIRNSICELASMRSLIGLPACPIQLSANPHRAANRG
jgi:hypothetical protein